MRILLLIILTVGVHSQCIHIRCNSTTLTSPCTNCSECRERATSFCLSGRTLRCGCATGVARDCRRVNTVLSEDIRICKVRENLVVPTPSVRPQGSTSISVIVPRFFGAPPFDSLNPSKLTLLADYATKKEPVCEQHPSIVAQKWGNNHCTLRIRLSMPGIDHKSDDHYYYDDQTPLESEYSVDLFENAEWVRFFVQVNLERPLKLAHETVIFSSLFRSDAALYRFPRSLGNRFNLKLDVGEIDTQLQRLRLIRQPLRANSNLTISTWKTIKRQSGSVLLGKKSHFSF